MYIYILHSMPKISSLLVAKPQIISLFENLKQGSLQQADLKDLLSTNRSTWKIAPSTSVRQFSNFLVQQGILQMTELQFPRRTFLRYSKPTCSILELAASISKNTYISHYSAIQIHDLSEQIPKTVYTNTEQGKKFIRRSVIKQKNIDLAFSRPWRISNRSAIYKDFRILWLNGMYTDNLGVASYAVPDGNDILVTDLERTLIDISVRPVYAGGIFQVLKAFKAALPRLDLDKLVSYLKKMQFIYPYHQAIGYFLEKAGMPIQEAGKLKMLGLDYDFYITHQIGNVAYSKEWRLYYPRGF